MAQTLGLPGPEGTPDSSGRALVARPAKRPDESGRDRHECLRHRVTSQAASNLIPFPARLGHLKKNGKTPGYGVNETIGRALIEVGTRRL